MLEHLFGSRTRVKLLRIFFRDPAKLFYARELSRQANVQLNAVRRELDNLLNMGIITPAVDVKRALEDPGTERSKFYGLNQSSLVYHELSALLLKARLMEEQELVEALKNKAGEIKLLLLTGVFTGADDSATDILIVGNIKPVTFSRIIKNFEKLSHTPVRYTVLDEKEFQDRREIGDRFLYGVFENKHMMIVNDYQIS